jgi:Family of unknown function (DUF5684)
MSAYALWSIIFYALVALLLACNWRILSKAGEPGWVILIPFVGMFRLLEITGRSGWWILAWLVPFLSWFVLVRMVFDLASVFGRRVRFGFGILLLWPIFLPLLAWGGSHYVGPRRNTLGVGGLTRRL